jgi:hypothetical protein
MALDLLWDSCPFFACEGYGEEAYCVVYAFLGAQDGLGDGF